MSSSESFQFSNMNDYTGEGSKSNGGRTDKTVCQVSVVSGFILTFLSVAIAIGIGIIVNFAGNNKSVTCSCRCGTGGTTPYPPGVPAACKLLALEGNQELCKYKCPLSRSITKKSKNNVVKIMSGMTYFYHIYAGLYRP